MIEIINNNPNRVLGVYATSGKKDIVANQGRMKAFLKVGRTCEFPLDLPSLLPPVVRTEESVADANARLTLPQDQLKYAQFWFVKDTSLDDIAFNHLLSGNTEQAVEIWAKRDNASSLQNRIVCALAKGSYGTAIQCAEKLYTSFSKELVVMVLGENATISADNLHETFLDVVLETQKPAQILGWISLPQWKEYVAKKSTKPLIDSILAAVETAKASKGQGPKARFDTGTKLMNDTKAQLAQLKSLLQTSDLQYQMVADKLGQEILQCGIDAYDKNVPYSAKQAISLLEYAQKIVVGQMAKDRCDENVEVLTKIIDNLPPSEVANEYNEILSIFNKSRNKHVCEEMKIALTNSLPIVRKIKQQYGRHSDIFIKTATIFTELFVNIIIGDINAAQDCITPFEVFKKAEEEKAEQRRKLRELTNRESTRYNLLSYVEMFESPMAMRTKWLKHEEQNIENLKFVTTRSNEIICLLIPVGKDRQYIKNRFNPTVDSLRSISRNLGITPEFDLNQGWDFSWEALQDKLELIEDKLLAHSYSKSCYDGATVSSGDIEGLSDIIFAILWNVIVSALAILLWLIETVYIGIRTLINTFYKSSNNLGER